MGVRRILSLILAAALSSLAAESGEVRRLANVWEIHDEVSVRPGGEQAFQSLFPSFFEYHDLIMFHPRFGYYGSGRVSFSSDYQTYPIVLAPYFGHMIAEQVFRMWKGMRKAGTIGPDERFTVAEFGAGNGQMAESILDYVVAQAGPNGDPEWRKFAANVLYICYDRSPALNKTQRERNARFGKRFEAREADATDPGAAIPPGSLKGVVLSNELPDAFSVHKVILSVDGPPEVAFVVPALPGRTWAKIRGSVPKRVAETVASGDQEARKGPFTALEDRVYLTRSAFVALLDALAGSADYDATAQALEFEEAYLPASAIPEVQEHLRRYAHVYAGELARSGRGIVTYVNPGAEKFIQGAGRVLAAGYVLTLDYGSNWEGIIAQEQHPHMRTYGPAHVAENAAGSFDDTNTAADKDTSDPYRGPTLNDLTTDVNFSILAAEGRETGLKTVYFGPQAALISGTSISLDEAPPDRQQNEALRSEFFTWAGSFRTDGNYKLMVQQKTGTDAAYTYASEKSEPLESDWSSLRAVQREKAAEIERHLRATPGGNR